MADHIGGTASFIHDELHLSATQVGIFPGLPSMLFAFAAAGAGSELIPCWGVGGSQRLCLAPKTRVVQRQILGILARASSVQAIPEKTPRRSFDARVL